MAVSEGSVSRRSLLKRAGAGAIVLGAGGIMTSSASANPKPLDICTQQAVDIDVAACGQCANQTPCGDGLRVRPHGQRMLLLPSGHLVCRGDAVQEQPAVPGGLEVRRSHVLRTDCRSACRRAAPSAAATSGALSTPG